MKPIEFDEANAKVAGVIPVGIYTDEHNPKVNYFISVWKPSEKDKEAILAGRPIVLQCHTTMPPIGIYTLDENGDSNYEPLL